MGAAGWIPEVLVGVGALVGTFGCVLCWICVAKEFGFDAPGALTPGTPASHEVWNAFKKIVSNGASSQTKDFGSVQTILIVCMEN